MTYPISEAFKLFQIEYRVEKDHIFDAQTLGEIEEISTIKVHRFASQIPLIWSHSEGTNYDSLSMESMVCEEVLYDYSMRDLFNKILKSLTKIIKQDLYARLFELSKKLPSKFKEILSANIDQKYRLLCQHSSGFVSDQNHLKLQEEQEIFSIRCTLLGGLPPSLNFKALEMQKHDFATLEAETKKHLDLIVMMGETEYLRMRSLNDILENQFKEVQEKQSESSSLLLHSIEPSSFPKIQIIEAVSTKSPKENLLNKGVNRFKQIQTMADSISIKLTKSQVEAFKTHSIGRWIISHIPPVIGKGARWVSKVLPYISLIGDAIVIRSRSRSQELKKVHRGQTIIMQNQRILQDQLTDIDQKVVTLCNNQKILAEGINKVIELIDAAHRETMQSLAYITHEVVLGRMALAAMLDHAGRLCRDARQHLKRDSGYRPYFNRFLSYDAFRMFYQKESLSLKEGLKGLPKLFMHPGRNDAPFIVTSNLNQKDHIYFQHFRGLWRRFNESTKGWKSQQKQFEFLLTPVFKIEQIAQLIEGFEGKPVPKLPPWIKDLFRESFLEDLFRAPYDFDRLLDYAESARCFHYFYELSQGKPGKSLVSLEKLSTHTPSPQGLRLLQNAFLRVEIGIAHCSLLVGNGLLPTLYKEWKEGKHKDVIDLITPNRLLTTNFILYAFKTAIKERKRLDTDYYFPFFHGSDDLPLKELVGENWEFTWSVDKKRWAIELDKDESFPIPTPTQLMNAALEIHPNLTDLLTMRKKLLKEIAGYQKVDLRESEKGVYHSGLLLTSLFFRTLLKEQYIGDVNDNNSTWGRASKL